MDSTVGGREGYQENSHTMSLFSQSPAIKLHYNPLFPRYTTPKFTTKCHCIGGGGGLRRPPVLKSRLQFASLTSSVGTPPSLPHARWTLDGKHLLLLNISACVAAISASWVFLAAIPTLLAFKRAAESLEKLLDVTAEELPDTMAAVRLSGMEISDLTMELSDLGQEISQGVRSSTRAVRVAEDRLRRLTSMAPTGASQPEE